MPPPVTHLSLVSSVQGLTFGQVSLINYVEVMGLLDESPFLRSPYDVENIPEKILAEIRQGERSVWEAPLCAAAGLVLKAASYEKTLLQKLGITPDAADDVSNTWASDDHFFPAVDAEVRRLRQAVSEAHDEVKAWMRALANYKDAYQYFDVTRDISDTGEDGLKASLTSLQAYFARSIQQAREAEKECGFRSLAGVEVYFDLARRRASGPLPRLSAEQIAAPPGPIKIA